MKTKSLRLPLGLFLLGCGTFFTSMKVEASDVLISSAVVSTEENTIYSNNIISSISNEVQTIENKSKEEIELLNKELENFNLEKLAFNKSSKSIYIYEKTDEKSKKVGVLPSSGIGEINDFREFKSDIDKFIAGEAEWFEINSGEITGYIKNEDLFIGTSAVEELNNSYNTTIKITSNSNVRVRVEPTIESDIIDSLKPDTIVKLNIEEFNEDDDWVPVIIEEDNGFIKKDLVTINNTVVYATKYVEPKSQSTKKANTNQKVIPPTEETPSAVVEYAKQFLGNPYVWGGTSLTNGCDCSGFVMKVYEAFGISLPHSSKSDRSVGRAVSFNEIQPGDIVCYDGHVGIYAGNGQIINALNRKSGIVYTNVNYDTVLAVRRVL